MVRIVSKALVPYLGIFLPFEIPSTQCHAPAGPALAVCPLSPLSSCRAAPVTPAWLSRTGTGNSSLLTGSQGKLDNLHKTTQRTSITMKQP